MSNFNSGSQEVIDERKLSAENPVAKIKALSMEKRATNKLRMDVHLYDKNMRDIESYQIG
ncbi:MAG: hypothetical protein HRU18_23555 [Pseudoalteromonas sp.]|uniref:hypothetical protein n=1 Tax=Pseudoalteromonas sp. TaxID=53249 RepID=UPI001D88EB0B|nr:hypothetical protein [Pseudoalteromonas sp.]NRA81187.1 hypothetical protein [Pseudoalteromonas sp.]